MSLIQNRKMDRTSSTGQPTLAIAVSVTIVVVVGSMLLTIDWRSARRHFKTKGANEQQTATSTKDKHTSLDTPTSDCATEYFLAQINVGRLKGDNLEDPKVREFKDNIDRIHRVAESSPGFVWRWKDDDQPYGEQVVVNISIWRTVEDFKRFAYSSAHAEMLKRKKEWFVPYQQPFLALWWVPAGTTVTVQEAVERLEALQSDGPSAFAFDFKRIYPATKALMKK